MRVTVSTFCWLILLTCLGACGQRQESAPVAQPVSVAATTPASPVAGQVPAGAGDNSRTEQGGIDAAELAADQRLLDAQGYLKQAEKQARERRQQALLACTHLLADEAANCETSAEVSLEAELRAARVEFDARMMQDP